MTTLQKLDMKSLLGCTSEKRLLKYFENQYLIKNGSGRFFVSDLHLNPKPDYTMKPNCKFGCLYFDDVASKTCISIDHFVEVYIIKETS